MIVKNHHRENMPVYLFALVILILVIYFLTSCYPARRAARQVAKAAVTYPEQTARQLRLIWPLDTTIRDTTIIEGDHAGYDEMIESLNDALRVQDSLITALAADTACVQYAEELKSLKEKVKSVKPVAPKTIVVTNTVSDRSAIAACEAERNKALDLAAKAQLNADVWHKTAKQRGYVMWAALGLILLFVVYKVIRLIK